MTAFTWPGSWSADSQFEGTLDINDNAGDESDDYGSNTATGYQFSLQLTYGGTYDQPALAYVQPKNEATSSYASRESSYMIIPLNGSASTTVEVPFFVGSEVGADFRIHVFNESGAQITNLSLDYKKQTVT